MGHGRRENCSGVRQVAHSVLFNAPTAKRARCHRKLFVELFVYKTHYTLLCLSAFARLCQPRPGDNIDISTHRGPVLPIASARAQAMFLYLIADGDAASDVWYRAFIGGLVASIGNVSGRWRALAKAVSCDGDRLPLTAQQNSLTCISANYSRISQHGALAKKPGCLMQIVTTFTWWLPTAALAVVCALQLITAARTTAAAVE
jgi:hypothetical protein